MKKVSLEVICKVVHGRLLASLTQVRRHGFLLSSSQRGKACVVLYINSVERDPDDYYFVGSRQTFLFQLSVVASNSLQAHLDRPA